MNLIPMQSNSHSEFLNVSEDTIRHSNNWRDSILLHISNSLTNGIAEDVRTNLPSKEEVISKQKLSALKGKVTKMNIEEIDKQLKSLRDEWQRDI